MQALVFREGRVQVVTNYPEPKPASDDVLIKVRRAGICATDLEIVKGYMGFSGVMGHEFVGEVLKGPKELLGKRVVGEINCVCGKCDMCQSGLSNHCRQRQTIGIAGHDGAFAEKLVLPRRNVHILPDTVDDDRAVFVEVLAAAYQIVKQVPIEPRAKVIVVGDGRLGLLAVQVLAQAAAPTNKVVLLGKHPDKLMFAEKRGIQGILLNEMLMKPEWDIVIDCTGSASGFTTACQLVRPRGRLVLKSTFAPGGEAVDLSPLVVNEVTVIGSRCGPFIDAINALAAERIITNGLITSRFRLSEGVEALKKAAQPDQLKVVLDIA